jgi:hypothetical protein
LYQARELALDERVAGIVPGHAVLEFLHEKLSWYVR